MERHTPATTFVTDNTVSPDDRAPVPFLFPSSVMPNLTHIPTIIRSHKTQSESDRNDNNNDTLFSSSSIPIASEDDNIDITLIDDNDDHHDDADDTMNLRIAAAAAFLVSDNGSLLRGGESPRDRQRFLFPESGLDRHLAAVNNIPSSMISLSTDSNNSISNSSCSGNTTTATGADREMQFEMKHFGHAASIDDEIAAADAFDILSPSQHIDLVLSEAHGLEKCDDDDEFLFSDTIFNNEDTLTDVDESLSMTVTTMATGSTSVVTSNYRGKVLEMNDTNCESFQEEEVLHNTMSDEILLGTSLTLMTRELAETIEANEKESTASVQVSNCPIRVNNIRPRQTVPGQEDTGMITLKNSNDDQSPPIGLVERNSLDAQNNPRSVAGQKISAFKRIYVENVSSIQRQSPPLETTVDYDALFLSHRKDLVCLICGKGEIDTADGSIRPIVRFIPTELDFVGCVASPVIQTMKEDVCLHVFCGKTASILPNVNRPDLEILSKAGLKNKHGIGQEVNSALARTRCAVIAHEIITACTNKGIHINTKEKHFYLVREFEAHLSVIRQSNSTYNQVANGVGRCNFLADMQEDIGIPHPGQSQESLSLVTPTNTIRLKNNDCREQKATVLNSTASSVTIRPSHEIDTTNQGIFTVNLSRLKQAPHAVGQIPPQPSIVGSTLIRNVNFKKRKNVPTSESEVHTTTCAQMIPSKNDCLLRLHSTNSDADSSDNDVAQISLVTNSRIAQEPMTLRKRVCPCGGFYHAAGESKIGTTKGNKSWRNHVSTKRHKKWMDKHAV